MPTLKKCFDKARLIVVSGATDQAVLNHVLDSRPNQMPVCTWSSQDGVQLIDPPGGLKAHLSALQNEQQLSKVLKAFQRIPEAGTLLIFDLDSLKSVASLIQPLEAQWDEEADAKPIETWMVFSATNAKQKDRLGEIVDKLKISPKEITAEVPVAPQPRASTPTRQGPQLELDQIGDREAFDDPAWTDYLNQLSFKQLQEIVEADGLVDAVRLRITSLIRELKKVLYGKEDIIDLMTWCSVAHLPLMLLGTWGTGKSMLVRQFSRGLGIQSTKRTINSEDELVAQLEQDLEKDSSQVSLRKGRQRILGNMAGQHFGRHFEYLVTRFTTPEELLGPVNIDLMLSQAIYLRQTQSLLPRAEIAFLDEVFKANSSILNALLSLINERLFYNAGLPWTVNMVMLFGASNEPPQEEDLGAFYDRFPVRVLCDSVGNDALRQLLDRAQVHQFLQLMGDEQDMEDAKAYAQQFTPPTVVNPQNTIPEWHECRLTAQA
ncbi:MAG: AAA family ATPase, partial [Planctomycetaceae bacterium]|nr:AAA family ATPase [Planctomycetaceae bacterium]